MTAQEAIEELKKHKETLNLWNCLPLDDLQSFDVAIEALEKQIPKNAVVLDKVYDEVRSCPTCEKDTVFHGRTFWCCRCGQLLRWE